MGNKKNDVQAAQMEQPVADGGEVDIQPEVIASESNVVIDNSSSIVSEDTTHVGQDTDCFSVVIPFFKDFCSTDSLILTVASVVRFLRYCDYKIIIIGDKPVVESDSLPDFIHIPYTALGVSDKDYAEVLKLAVADEDVSDKFIFMTTDMLIVDFVTMAHIEVCKHLGIINPKRYLGAERTMMDRTLTLIQTKMSGIPFYDYNSHVPVVYEKDKLMDLFDEFPELMSGDYHIPSVYFNGYACHPVKLDYQTDQWVLPVINEHPNKSAIDRYVSNKCFVYCAYPNNMQIFKPMVYK